MKKLALTLGIISLSASAMAFAGGPDTNMHNAPTSRTGFYLGAGVGYGYLGDPVSEGGFALATDVGYQFTPNFSGEVGYNGTFFSVGGANFTSSLVTFLVKGQYNVSDMTDVFAKAGLGLAFLSASANGVSISSDSYAVPVIGGGFDYYFNDHVALTGQALYSFKATYPSTIAGTLGVTYKF